MFQLIYASTATRPFSQDDLETLVEHSRRKNERLAITGVLMHRNGSFLHVLEGEDEETVRTLYKTIRADERHEWITLLRASSLEKRDFPGRPLVFSDRSMPGARQALPRSGTPQDLEVLFGSSAGSSGTKGTGAKSAAAGETLIQFGRAGASEQSPSSPPDLPASDSEAVAS